MEREHCQIEHRKSKSCPTARQIKFDSVGYLQNQSWAIWYGRARVRTSFWKPRFSRWWKIKNPRSKVWRPLDPHVRSTQIKITNSHQKFYRYSIFPCLLYGMPFYDILRRMFHNNLNIVNDERFYFLFKNPLLNFVRLFLITSHFK